MEATRLNRVLIRLPDEIVEITSDERDGLLEQLVFVAGSKTIREKLEVGANRPVALDREQRTRLQAALRHLDNDVWLPDGIGRLLEALERADQSIAGTADRAG
jgi:hypothetical protein